MQKSQCWLLSLGCKKHIHPRQGKVNRFHLLENIRRKPQNNSRVKEQNCQRLSLRMGAGLCHPASTWGLCRAQGVTGGMEALESAQWSGRWVIPISQKGMASSNLRVGRNPRGPTRCMNNSYLLGQWSSTSACAPQWRVVRYLLW